VQSGAPEQPTAPGRANGADHRRRGATGQPLHQPQHHSHVDRRRCLLDVPPVDRDLHRQHLRLVRRAVGCCGDHVALPVADDQLRWSCDRRAALRAPPATRGRPRSTYSGASGRGPSSAISPRTTLSSWGSSSRCERPQLVADRRDAVVVRRGEAHPGGPARRGLGAHANAASTCGTWCRRGRPGAPRSAPGRRRGGASTSRARRSPARTAPSSSAAITRSRRCEPAGSGSPGQASSSVQEHRGARSTSSSVRFTCSGRLSVRSAPLVADRQADRGPPGVLGEPGERGAAAGSARWC
jgi:hypothetical protein